MCHPRAPRRRWVQRPLVVVVVVVGTVVVVDCVLELVVVGSNEEAWWIMEQLGSSWSVSSVKNCRGTTPLVPAALGIFFVATVVHGVTLVVRAPITEWLVVVPSSSLTLQSMAAAPAGDSPGNKDCGRVSSSLVAVSNETRRAGSDGSDGSTMALSSESSYSIILEELLPDSLAMTRLVCGPFVSSCCCAATAIGRGGQG